MNSLGNVVFVCFFAHNGIQVRVKSCIGIICTRMSLWSRGLISTEWFETTVDKLTLPFTLTANSELLISYDVSLKTYER